jgi:hypothetical protein
VNVLIPKATQSSESSCGQPWLEQGLGHTVPSSGPALKIALKNPGIPGATFPVAFSLTNLGRCHLNAQVQPWKIQALGPDMCSGFSFPIWKMEIKLTIQFSSQAPKKRQVEAMPHTRNASNNSYHTHSCTPRPL